jgi:phosphoglycolate phosphatase-like HAD superfamily hydrolase
MIDYEKQLRSFQPRSDFFIGIDSDGCVFDSMELKHKECFCPAFIDNLELQGVSRFARQTWDFVNLYSSSRGVNRFIALVRALDILRTRTEIKERGVSIPRLPDLEDWISREKKLGMKTLEAEMEHSSSADLKTAWAWSMDVNAAVQKIVRGVAPFALVESTLLKMSGNADAVVVSQTPVHNIEQEWQEHNIAPYVQLIAGQEMGTKSMHLEVATSGKYPQNHVLMLGDAPGDLEAARENGALFFPIIPGEEDQSWKVLHDQGLDRFFNGSFAGTYEKSLIERFLGALPEEPDWDRL